MKIKAISRLALTLSILFSPLISADVSGLIYNVQQQQRTFELEGNRYQIPDAIPIKYSLDQKKYFKFAQLEDGVSLRVRFTRGNAGVRTVIEAVLQPL